MPFRRRRDYGMTPFVFLAAAMATGAGGVLFEMTGHQGMLLPIMLGALLGFLTSKGFGAAHLYQTLAARYEARARAAPAETAPAI